jgi:hypothetical protein
MLNKIAETKSKKINGKSSYWLNKFGSFICSNRQNEELKWKLPL